jgi:hypothetical protein
MVMILRTHLQIQTMIIHLIMKIIFHHHHHLIILTMVIRHMQIMVMIIHMIIHHMIIQILTMMIIIIIVVNHQDHHQIQMKTIFHIHHLNMIMVPQMRDKKVLKKNINQNIFIQQTTKIKLKNQIMVKNAILVDQMVKNIMIFMRPKNPILKMIFKI